MGTFDRSGRRYQAIEVSRRVQISLWDSYVSYEQGLGTVTSSLVKLDYALSRCQSLCAETGTSSGWRVVYRVSWE